MKDVLQLEMIEISRDFITHIQIKKCTNALAFHIIFIKGWLLYQRTVSKLQAYTRYSEIRVGNRCVFYKYCLRQYIRGVIHADYLWFYNKLPTKGRL